MLGEIVWRGFSLLYGFVSWIAMVARAVIREGAFTKKMDEEEKRQLAAAQKRYWSLDQEPFPGFTHRFFRLRNGLKLHYVLNSNAGTSSAKNVAIFIHGFPDSFLLWRNILKSSSLESHILIAVDLPGYGGSDSFPRYGPNEVLEAMAEFILGMRTEHMKEGSKMVVASHDWGAIVSARLAAEASQLADRWVIASAIIPEHVLSNASTRFASAKQMLHTYLRRPLNIRLLKNALSTLVPIISQLGRSFYVFIFRLPYPFSTSFVTFGNYWFLKLLHNVAAGLLRPDGSWSRKLGSKETAEFLSMSAGPSVTQILEAEGEYPESVRKRAGDWGMSEKIRIYREHLLLNPWEKSLETVVELSEIPTSLRRSSSGAGFLDEGPAGALKAPATVVYGIEDRSFDKRLGLEGLGDYLVKGSQLLTIAGAGHWLPFEGVGSKVLEEVVDWAMGDENEPLSETLEAMKDVRFVVEK